jgi:hypothetical protein
LMCTNASSSTRMMLLRLQRFSCSLQYSTARRGRVVKHSTRDCRCLPMVTSVLSPSKHNTTNTTSHEHTTCIMMSSRQTNAYLHEWCISSPIPVHAWVLAAAALPRQPLRVRIPVCLVGLEPSHAGHLQIHAHEFWGAVGVNILATCAQGCRGCTGTGPTGR